MNKTIIAIAILGLSTSAALAAKAHHMKKPVESTATTPSGPMMMPFGAVSSADKEMYMKNKHDSGMK